MPKRVHIFILSSALLLPGMLIAQDARSNFRESGTGLWVEAGQKSELVVVLQVRENRPNVVTVTVRPINGIPRRFSGSVTTEDGAARTIQISKADGHSATGTLFLEYQDSDEFKFAMGRVKSEGREFLFHFSKNRPLRWNAITLGNGTLNLHGASNDVTVASVMITMNGDTRLSLMSEDGAVRRIRAQISSTRDTGPATHFELVVADGPGETTTGTLKIQRHPANYGITTIEGDGQIDGSRFRISFDARDSNPSKP